MLEQQKIHQDWIFFCIRIESVHGGNVFVSFDSLAGLGYSLLNIEVHCWLGFVFLYYYIFIFTFFDLHLHAKELLNTF